MHASPILVALLALAHPVQAATKKHIEMGKSFAIEACSACHQVKPDQKPPPPVFDSNEQVLDEYYLQGIFAYIGSLNPATKNNG